MTVRTAILAFTFVLANAGAVYAQSGPFYGSEYGGGYPGGYDAGGTNDTYRARNSGPFRPDGTGGNYEYFRSSGPDRGNNIESQR